MLYHRKEHNTSNEAMTTDTPLTNACPHCGARKLDYTNYICGTTYSIESRGNLCLERENSKKLEAEVERLRELLSLEKNGHEGTKKICDKILDLTRKTPSRAWHRANKKIPLK